MKKIVSLAFIVLIICHASADDLFGINSYLAINIENKLCIYNNHGYFLGYDNSKKDGLLYYQEISNNENCINENGFPFIYLLGRMYFYIYGGGYSVFFDADQLKNINTINKYHQSSDEMYNHCGIKKIDASSFYSEQISNQIINYKPVNMIERFIIPDSKESPDYIWNYQSYPWVANNSKNVGEKIYIELINSSNVIVILNGYVDIEKQQLFKQNSRLKRIALYDDKHTKLCEYEFRDIVEFSTINLQRKVNKITIEVLEIYKGSKWNDTCVSAILDQKGINVLSNTGYENEIREMKRKGKKS